MTRISLAARSAKQQLEVERRQHAFVMRAMEQERALLVRDLAAAKYELAQRDLALAFAAMPSPSQSKH